ncbi:hypothetical protein VTN00DRAFT_7670 [Thermoascus crustaceus]|uniref:uncharacterized protein n=1 Tax=Thermoascus crustaceus TaxID=5088 RepID=UPI003741F664
MEFETRVPYTHRFKYAALEDRSVEELESNRDYWGPWLLTQFLYHTILCLLNHPLLLSLSLRNFRSTIPEIFLQHTSDLISSHTNWIIYFIKFFEEKQFKVSDPFLGYSAAVVATIELQLSFTEDLTIRTEKQSRFSRCVDFVRGFGGQWPHMEQLADKLQGLQGAVTASYQPTQGSQNKSLLIDLSRFWEILEYSSSSSSDSARHLLGESLRSGPVNSAAEVSSTSPLPEPTRLSPQATQHQTTRPSDFVSSASSRPVVPGFTQTTQLDLPNDEFSILAENFFSQGQDFLRSVDGWSSMGNL